VELRDDLEAIVMDTTVEVHDRVAAGWVLARLPDPHRTAALRPLALDDAARGDDPLDELKGVALLASWPQAISNAEVFSVLTPRRPRNYHGSYAMFIDRFRDGITVADIDTGLQWLLGDLSGPADDHTTGGLANRVLELASMGPTRTSVIDAFTRLVLARVEHYDGLLFEDFRDEHRSDPFADPALRRAVAAAVLESDSTDLVVHRLSGHGSYSLGLIRLEDLEWLTDLYARTSGDRRNAVRSLFHWTFDVRLVEHRDLILNMARDHPLHLDLVHDWVDPVALDSPDAEQMRRSWEMVHGPKLAKDVTNDDVNEQIEDLLGQFDNGEAVGFWHTMRLLTVAPGSKHFGAEFDPNIVGMKRWPTLSEELRERIADAAERYLRSQRCGPEQWLDKPEIRYFPAEAGYRAMVLLLRVAPGRLGQLPASAWIE
jgi:hypothetical protein